MTSEKPTPIFSEPAGTASGVSPGLESDQHYPLKRLSVILLIAIFLAELVIMYVLSELPDVSFGLVAVLDALLLTILVVPAIYWLAFRPLREQLRAREAVEAEVLSLNQSLEKRIEARTHELVVVNKGMQRSIAAHQDTEASLQESLREQTALLKEVHHRVKNNLQVITSLLRLEVSRHPELATKTVIEEMQSRIRSMALLHETLYRTGNFAAVDLADYLRKLAVHLDRGQNSTPERVRLALNLAAVEVGIDEAIPCGLIVNELLTNAHKHGFPEGRAGVVQLDLQVGPDGQVQLQVCDDGVGMPEGFDPAHANTLGLQLVSDLARQLPGVLAIGPGATFKVTFMPGSDSGDS